MCFRFSAENDSPRLFSTRYFHTRFRVCNISIYCWHCVCNRKVMWCRFPLGTRRVGFLFTKWIENAKWPLTAIVCISPESAAKRSLVLFGFVHGGAKYGMWNIAIGIFLVCSFWHRLNYQSWQRCYEHFCFWLWPFWSLLKTKWTNNKCYLFNNIFNSNFLTL